MERIVDMGTMLDAKEFVPVAGKLEMAREDELP